MSRGSGLSIEAFGRILFARDMTGLAGSFLGRRIQTFGVWRAMIWAGLLSSAAMLLVALGPIGIVVGLVTWGIFRTVLLIALNTWVADAVAYERRGQATGLVELTWAAAALIGVPAMGLLIDIVGWRAAPIALAVIGAPAAMAIARMDEPPLRTAAAGTTPVTAAEPVSRSTTVALIMLALPSASAQFLLFTHGLWLEDAFGFDPAQVGFAIVGVGLAEAASSYATSRITDGLGKQRSVVAGTAVMAAALIVLSIVPEPPLAIGLASLIVAFLGFEFAIVSSIPLSSELQPDSRPAVLGRSVGITTVGRAVVSAIAGVMYVRYGFRSTMIAGTLVAVAAMIGTMAFVTEPDAAADGGR